MLEPENLGENNATDIMAQQLQKDLEPLMPTQSKKFKQAIIDGIEQFGNKIKDTAKSPLTLPLPAQNKAFQQRNDVNYAQIKKDFNDKGYTNASFGGSAIFTTPEVTTKQSKLFTIQTDFSENDIPDKDKKYIIYFNGNGEFAMNTANEMMRDAERHQCVVINFDYPGVGESTGKSYRSEHMVNAGMAQVERLLERGVPAENIVLKGQSIGGGVATVTAAKLHEQGHKVNVYNQRSFSKLSEAAKHLMGGGVLGKIAAFAIKKTGWEIDAIAAWNKIPDDCKDFCFAKNDKVLPPDKSGLAGAIGKLQDTERALDLGDDAHNVVISEQLETQPFDNFMKQKFAKLSVITLSNDEKKLIENITKKDIKQNRNSMLFNFNHTNENKVPPNILEVLNDVKENGKLTHVQLSTLESYCQIEKKNAKGFPSSQVNALEGFIRTMKAKDTFSPTSPSRRASLS